MIYIEFWSILELLKFWVFMLKFVVFSSFDATWILFLKKQKYGSSLRAVQNSIKKEKEYLCKNYFYDLLCGKSFSSALPVGFRGKSTGMIFTQKTLFEIFDTRIWKKLTKKCFDLLMWNRENEKTRKNAFSHG